MPETDALQIDSCFEISAPDVVAEDFGSEMVILNLANGKYFSLLGSAAILWRDLAAGHTPRNILEKLDAPFVAAVEQFLTDITREQLIRPTSGQVETASTTPESIACFAQGSELPKLEVYDDMAELILSDPIHDVEEDVGWPVRRMAD